MAVALHCETIGSGSPVLVLHGLFGAARNWLTIARRLADAHTFHLVDLRNHGRSPHTDSMTYLDMVDDVRALVDALGLHSFALVGHSMGGKAAMTMALNDAAGINKLIAIDIAPVSYPDRFVEMITAMLALDLSQVRRRNDADVALSVAIPRSGCTPVHPAKSSIRRWHGTLARQSACLAGADATHSRPTAHC
jgi:esterase